ncbi:hypothetical protein WJ976_11585 [Achromobacter denitrificans]
MRRAPGGGRLRSAKRAFRMQPQGVQVFALPAFAHHRDHVRHHADRDADDGGRERHHHVFGQRGQVASRQAVQRGRHRDQGAHQAERRPRAHGEAHRVQAARAGVFGARQHAFDVQVHVGIGCGGGRVDFRRQARHRRPAAAPAARRAAREHAQRDQGPGRQHDQHEQHGDEQELGDLLQDEFEVHDDYRARV